MKDEIVSAARKLDEQECCSTMITDGFGNYWSERCHCGRKNEIVRAGKVQCGGGCENLGDIDKYDRIK